MSQIDLYCIPYAGGSANAIYGKWAGKIDPLIKIQPLELAGHGKRMSEPFHPSVKSVVDDMLGTIQSQIKERPYALFGHSMGSLIAYELAMAARDAGLQPPRALFLSGRQPPHHVYKNNDVHLYSDDEFIGNIRRIGGTPPQLLESKELMKVFLPILRNDYRIIEQYTFKEPEASLDTDLVFFYSDQDYLVDKTGILEWERYITQNFEYHEFSGGHFYLNEVWHDLCEVINKKLISTPISKKISNLIN